MRRFEAIIDKIEKAYALEIYHVRPINAGMVNNNFEIVTNEGIFFLRIYGDKIIRNESDLILEHRVLNHLTGAGFERFAKPLNIKNSNHRYLRTPFKTLLRIGEKHYAVFDFIEGRDASNSDYKVAARTLAYYHNAVKNFECPSSAFFTDNIWESYLTEYVHLQLENPKTDFDKILSRFLSDVRDYLQDINVTLHERDYGLLRLTCHNDYHPGNIRIRKDKAYITDFEGVGYNYRIYELAFAVIGFCTKKDPGDLKKEVNFWKEAKVFFANYTNISKLAPEEIELIPEMIKATYIILLPRIIRHHYQNTIETDKRIKDETLSTIINSFDWCNENSRLIIEDLKSMN